MVCSASGKDNMKTLVARGGLWFLLACVTLAMVVNLMRHRVVPVMASMVVDSVVR